MKKALKLTIGFFILSMTLGWYAFAADVSGTVTVQGKLTIAATENLEVYFGKEVNSDGNFSNKLNVYQVTPENNVVNFSFSVPTEEKGFRINCQIHYRDESKRNQPIKGILREFFLTNTGFASSYDKAYVFGKTTENYNLNIVCPKIIDITGIAKLPGNETVANNHMIIVSVVDKITGQTIASSIDNNNINPGKNSMSFDVGVPEGTKDFCLSYWMPVTDINGVKYFDYAYYSASAGIVRDLSKADVMTYDAGNKDGFVLELLKYTAPTPVPEVISTPAPTVAPTNQPVAQPTATPSNETTIAPTALPSSTPAAIVPTITPTVEPTVEPTVAPTPVAPAASKVTAAKSSVATTVSLKNGVNGTVIKNGATIKGKVVVAIAGTNIASKKIVKDNKKINWPVNNTFSEKGKYTITVTDKSGKVVNTTFVIK